MARQTDPGRLLQPNVRTIEKVIGREHQKHTEYRISGRRGLVLHVLPGSTATWYLHYDVRCGGKRYRRKLKLGRYGDLSLAKASEEADKHRSRIAEGKDPANEKERDLGAISFAQLVDDRFDRGTPLRPSTKRDYEGVLRRDILPVLGNRSASSIRRDDVISILDAICDRGSTRRADIAKNVISSMFAYGADRGLVESNPASDLRNRHDNSPRDCIATPADIRCLWTAMDAGQAAMSPTVVRIVKLALLTGLRRSEIAAATKDELDLASDAPTLTIPRGRAKNRTIHRVPLSPQAAKLFGEAFAASGSSTFLFPGERGSHIAARSISKAMERTRERIGVKDITIHDLRRTVGTNLSQLGVPKHVRERVLNHTAARRWSITDGVYNQYEYDAEKRAALELWAEALDAIVANRSVELETFSTRLSRLKGSELIRVG